MLLFCEQVFVKEELLRTTVLQMYNEIVDSAVTWKCRTERRVVPKDDSEIHNSLMRDVRININLPVYSLTH